MLQRGRHRGLVPAQPGCESQERRHRRRLDGYDAANPLVGAAYPDGTTAAWGYDPVGNRTGATLNGVPALTTYDAANRLTAQGAALFGSDANGNRTTGPAEAASTGDDADERPSARDERPPTARP